MKLLFTAPLFAAALMIAGAAEAADIRALASALKAAAFDERRPLPRELDDLSYKEALALMDRLNQSHIGQLLRQHQQSRRRLPDNILSALRYASPSHGGRVDR